MPEAAPTTPTLDTASLPDLDMALDDVEAARKACTGLREAFSRLRSTIGEVMVGQDEVVIQTLIALFADGHVLL